jgi:hypothetical protein
VNTTAQPNAIETRIRELQTAGIVRLGTYSTAAVAAFYDGIAYNEHTPPLMNCGLWDDLTCTHQQAAENLVTTLVVGMHRRAGKVLDVACGFGATTKLLTRH